LLQGLPQAGRAAVGKGPVELLQPARLRLLAVVALAVVGALIDRHHGVPREADHDRTGVGRRDVQQHRRVRTGSLGVAVPVSAGTRVRADDQDVFRAVQWRRALAQFPIGDGDVVDAVVHAAVGGVGAERDEGDRQRGEDPDNAYHRMAAENATDPAGRLTDLRTPAGPPRRLPEAGPPAAIARPTALASAFRVLVAAHCCCSALLGMNRGSRRDGLYSVPGMGSILSGEAWACGDIKMQSVGAATLSRLLPAEYGGGSAACRPVLE